MAEIKKIPVLEKCGEKWCQTGTVRVLKEYAPDLRYIGRYMGLKDEQIQFYSDRRNWTDDEPSDWRDDKKYFVWGFSEYDPDEKDNKYIDLPKSKPKKITGLAAHETSIDQILRKHLVFVNATRWERRTTPRASIYENDNEKNIGCPIEYREYFTITVRVKYMDDNNNIVQSEKRYFTTSSKILGKKLYYSNAPVGTEFAIVRKKSKAGRMYYDAIELIPLEEVLRRK